MALILLVFLQSAGAEPQQRSEVPGEPGAVRRLHVPYFGEPLSDTTTQPVNVLVSQFDVNAFPVVDVLVQVKDGNGKLIEGLTDADFDVEEDGVTEEILSVEELTAHAQLSVALVIDVSGSMNSGLDSANAASSLEHSNICTVHEIDETKDGQIFICMAYYEGETLKKKIERGPLEIEGAV